MALKHIYHIIFFNTIYDADVKDEHKYWWDTVVYNYSLQARIYILA